MIGIWNFRKRGNCKLSLQFMGHGWPGSVVRRLTRVPLNYPEVLESLPAGPQFPGDRSNIWYQIQRIVESTVAVTVYEPLLYFFSSFRRLLFFIPFNDNRCFICWNGESLINWIGNYLFRQNELNRIER